MTNYKSNIPSKFLLYSSLLLGNIVALAPGETSYIYQYHILFIIFPISAFIYYISSNIIDLDINYYLEFLSWGCFAGYLLIISSILFNIESNLYNPPFPILENILFLLGFSLFIICSFIALFAFGPNIIKFIIALASFSLILSYIKIDSEIFYPIDMISYYEMLFLYPSFYLKLLLLIMSYIFLSDISKTQISTIFKGIFYGLSLYIILAQYIYNIDSVEYLTPVNIYSKYVILFLGILAFANFALKIFDKHLLLLCLSLIIASSISEIFLYEELPYQHHKQLLAYATILSIMSYIVYKIFNKIPYLLQNAKIQITISFICYIMIIAGIAENYVIIFASISGIIFAIICFINIIIEPKTSKLRR